MARVLFAQQNTIKTAFRFSRINFYFVTAFYSLYDICMATAGRHSLLSLFCCLWLLSVTAEAGNLCYLYDSMSSAVSWKQFKIQRLYNKYIVL